ncbi:PspC domain-containing protein [Candidatus Woesebacteria bacterium]|nr:PspC domain-containing protein [Candidatus Woesebacteria bacterium]
MSRRRLVRNTSEAWLGGVCAGLADYFDIDVVFVRLVWVFLLIPGGVPGILPYILLWILMPESKLTR